jgi:hypothetical protein
MPCLLGTGRCLKHQDQPNPPELGDHLKHLTRLEHTEDVSGTLWCDEMSRDVYDSQCEVVGHLTEDNVLELYTYESNANL